MEAKPRRGGVNQRLKRLREEQQGSELAVFLALSFAWGELSPQTVAKIATLACSDMAKLKQGTLNESSLQQIARIGGEGRHPNDMSKDMLRILPRSGLPERHSMAASIQRVTPRGLCITTTRIPTILPHEMFAALFHSHQSWFKRSVCPSEDSVRAFWDGQQQNPFYQRHPVRSRLDHRTRAVPIALHGDEVAAFGINTTWQKGLDIVSWTSLLGSGSTIEKLFLCSIFSTCIAARNMREHWKLLRWSLKWLMLGRWPTSDEEDHVYEPGEPAFSRAGQQLADGWYACVYMIRGDLEWLWKYFDFPKHHSRNPCGYCAASKCAGPLSWKNLVPDAASFATSYLEVPPWCTNPLLQDLPVSFQALWPDYMHCKHLGSDQYFYGSVMVLMIVTFLEGALDTRLEALLEKIKEYHRRVGGRSLTGLSWGRLSVKADNIGASFPRFKGKAKETSRLGPALLSLWTEMMRPGVESQIKVKEALTFSVEMDRILSDYKHESCLAPDVAREFREATFGFLRLQCELQASATGMGMCFFNVTIKSHYIAHLGLRAHLLNPALGGCYAGEDFMQHMKRLSKRCAAGNAASQVPHKMVEKYLRGLGAHFNKELLFR